MIIHIMQVSVRGRCGVGGNEGGEVEDFHYNSSLIYSTDSVDDEIYMGELDDHSHNAGECDR